MAPSKGAHGTFGRVLGTFITPFHRHSEAYHGEVISQQMTKSFKGRANRLCTGAGSYWFVLVNAVHVTACVSETPFKFCIDAGSAIDLHPVK
jgi:hypothetical protein